MILLGCITFLVLAIAWFGGDLFILLQVRTLIGLTKRIASGERGVRAGVARNSGELSQLALAFDEMAVALEQQEAEARRRAVEIGILHEIGQTIIKSSDLKPVLEGILDKALLVGGCDIGVIRMLDPDTEILLPALSRGYRSPEQIRPHNIRFDGTVAGKMEAEVFARGEVFLVENIPASEGLRTFKKEGVQTVIAIPIKIDDKVLGMIQIGSHVPRTFSPEQIRLLEAMGNQLGVAVQKSNLHEKTQRAYKETQALFTITTVANQSLNLETILNQVVRTITELFEFDMTRIYLIDPAAEDSVLIRASYESSPELSAPVGPERRSHGISGVVINSGNPLIFTDILSDPRYDELSRTKNLKQSSIRFFATFPIKSQGKILGIISIYQRSPRSLTSDENALFNAVGEQVGIAVENASLYEQTTAKARELSTLYATAAIASESLDAVTLLHGILKKVLAVFALDAGCVYLRERDGKELHPAASEGFPDVVAVMNSYPETQRLLGQIVETGKALSCNDLPNDTGPAQAAIGEIMLKAGFRTALFLPIRVRGETLGVINLLNKQPHGFPANEVALLNSVAYHLGVALGNANLFSQVKQKSIELEKANKGKDEFLNVISHELRTPLNIIMGYTAMVQEGELGEIQPEQKEAFKKVAKQSEYLLTMVNDILRVTRIEAGRAIVEKRNFDLVGFLDDIKSSYQFASGKELILRWDYPQILPVMASDDDKLRHILQNLINNAIKFTQTGTVTVAAAVIAGFSDLELRVADTGPGISKELLPSIFEMFRQADSSETRTYDGLGLGLYIAKQYTELLGGTIAVKSELGKGSTFTVMIPMARHRDSTTDWVDESQVLTA